MEQRRAHGKGQWYHETQSRTQPADAIALVPEAAHVTDRFLLDLTLPESTLRDARDWLTLSRHIAGCLFPDAITVTRLDTFSVYERLSTALTVAQVYGVQRLCNHYAARLAPLPGPDSSRESNRRLAQITEYARQLASSPSLIGAASRRQLDEVGLTPNDIVLITQIVGFISYQARTIAAGQALLGLPVRWLPGMPVQGDAPAALFQHSQVPWRPDIAGLESRVLSLTQQETLARISPSSPLQSLVPLLAHDETTLRYLDSLVGQLWDDSVATALVTLLSARINGSPDCFHQQALRWTGATGLPEAVRNGDRALLAWSHHHPELHPLILAAQLLTRSPDRFSAAQLTPLFSQGLCPANPLTLLAWCGLSGWLNRLKIGLGTVQPIT